MTIIRTSISSVLNHNHTNMKQLALNEAKGDMDWEQI